MFWSGINRSGPPRPEKSPAARLSLLVSFRDPGPVYRVIPRVSVSQ